MKPLKFAFVLVTLLSIFCTISLTKSVYAEDVLDQPSKLRLESIQNLLSQKVTRAVQNIVDLNPDSAFAKDIKALNNLGYTIYNFNLQSASDSPSDYVKRNIDTMSFINNISGRKNLNLVNLSLYTDNKNNLLGDRLSNGQYIKYSSYVCPNAFIFDLSSTTQKNIYLEYIKNVILEYKNTPEYADVVGFFPAYGTYGETGYFTGFSGCTGINNEFSESTTNWGQVSSGYSVGMLDGFKVYYNSKIQDRTIPNNLSVNHLVNLINSSDAGKDTWPITDTKGSDKSKMFAYFLMYRKEIVLDFQKQISKVVKDNAPTKALVGFCYLPATHGFFANGWSTTPNADFCSAQTGIGSVGTARRLVESDFIQGNDYTGKQGAGSVDDLAWAKENAELTIQWGGNPAGFTKNPYMFNGFTNAITDVLNRKASLLPNQFKYNSQVAIYVPTYVKYLDGKIDNRVPFISVANLYMNEIIKQLYDQKIAFDFVSEDELFDFSYMDRYKTIVLPYQRYLSTLLPNKYNALIARYGAILVGSDGADKINFTDLQNRLQTKVYTQPDRCSYTNVCTTSTNVTYLTNNMCKTTCGTLATIYAKEDFNKDTKVNTQDLSLLISNLNTTDSTNIKKYDLTPDNKVNVQDLSIFLFSLGLK